MPSSSVTLSADQAILLQPSPSTKTHSTPLPRSPPIIPIGLANLTLVTPPFAVPSAPLYSPSFTQPSLSPRSPNGSRKLGLPLLGRLDTSDHVLRGHGIHSASTAMMAGAMTGIDANGTGGATAGGAGRRRIGSAMPTSMSMSIQTLCHVQSQSPTRSRDSSMHLDEHTRLNQQHPYGHYHYQQHPSSSLPSSQSHSHANSPYPPPPHHHQAWFSSPLTPKTDLSVPPFEISTILPNILYLGPSPTTASHVSELVGHRIREVLNMALECEDEEGRVKEAMMEGKYWKIGMRDFVEEEGVQESIKRGCEILGSFLFSFRSLLRSC